MEAIKRKSTMDEISQYLHKFQKQHGTTSYNYKYMNYLYGQVQLLRHENELLKHKYKE